MRVLMTTTGHAGHVLSLLPFANALMRAGHDVCVAGRRSRAEFIRRAGLVCWPFDDPPEHECAPVRAALPRLSVQEATERVIGDALPPVDAAVDLLRAISAHARTMPLQRR